MSLLRSRNRLLLCAAILTPPGAVGAQESPSASLLRSVRPVHTYSIVARDPGTGELGVAVQSHWFSVGSSVPWAESGVGAVATQSFIDPSYGGRERALSRFWQDSWRPMRLRRSAR